MDPREKLLERYEAASVADDFDAMGRLRHPDWFMLWPQSGEVVRGHANYWRCAPTDPKAAAPGSSRCGGAARARHGGPSS